MGYPQLPQRPIPPVHHVWVARPGDARRLYRGAVWRIPGLLRLGIVWALVLALLIFAVVMDPTHNVTWLVIGLIIPVLFVFLILRRAMAQEAMMAPGSVWATGFGANELLIVTPISTVVIDYMALRPPKVVGPAVLIQTKRLASSTSLPLELIPPDAFTFLQQRTLQSA